MLTRLGPCRFLPTPLQPTPRALNHPTPTGLQRAPPGGRCAPVEAPHEAGHHDLVADAGAEEFGVAVVARRAVLHQRLQPEPPRRHRLARRRQLRLDALRHRRVVARLRAARRAPHVTPLSRGLLLSRVCFASHAWPHYITEHVYKGGSAGGGPYQEGVHLLVHVRLHRGRGVLVRERGALARAVRRRHDVHDVLRLVVHVRQHGRLARPVALRERHQLRAAAEVDDAAVEQHHEAVEQLEAVLRRRVDRRRDRHLRPPRRSAPRHAPQQPPRQGVLVSHVLVHQRLDDGHDLVRREAVQAAARGGAPPRGSARSREPLHGSEPFAAAARVGAVVRR